MLINVSVVAKGMVLKFKLLYLLSAWGELGNSPFFSDHGELQLSCHEGELVMLESKLLLCCLLL